MVGLGTCRDGVNELGLDKLVAALYDCDRPKTPGGGERDGLASKETSPGGVKGFESFICFNVNIGFCLFSFNF